MSLIGYARVSTRDQSLDAQLETLTAAGAIKVFGGKQSGKSEKNDSELKSLLEYVREGDTVVVTKLDRLGRSLSSIINTLQSLSDKKVAFKSLDGVVDTSNDNKYQKAIVALLAAFADIERDLITERLQAGRERTGNKGGRKTALSAQDELEVVGLFKEGATKYALAKQFNTSRQSIMRLLIRNNVG
jgi:DNA invertase Pin-like site-specific DNA recombinase